jgi:carboxylesterase type B
MQKVFVFAATLALAGGLRATVPEPVKIAAGLISGTSGAVSGIRVFKGIPFAVPPVGELRWRAPQPVAKWTGVRSADTFGAVCVQPKGVGRLNVASASDRALAERVSSYWVNFARTGDPNGKGLPRWPAFSDASAAPMIIGEINETPDPQRLAIYDKLYAKILADLKK